MLTNLNILKHGTKLPNNYHQAFIKRFEDIDMVKRRRDVQKDLKARFLLLKRKSFLNKRFEYTPENMLKFEALSNKFTEVQNDIHEKYFDIDRKAKCELIENGGKFNDIEFSDSFIINFICDVEDIEEIYSSGIIYNPTIYDDKTAFEHETQDYSDYEVLTDYKNKFKHFFQSRLFHHLVHESHLALQDILLIDRVWIDISVQCQTEVRLK
jgi:hypothetical protein